MTKAFRPRRTILFLGDLLFFVFALWLSLFLRAFEVPTQELFVAHLVPFSALFLVWAIVFFIAGLYESRSIVLARRALSTTLLVAQTINISFAALFFFIVPYFGITPKTLLVIYLVVSFVLVLLWRAFFFPWLGLQKTENAILVGEGKENEQLEHALNRAHQAPARIAATVSPQSPTLAEDISDAILKHEAPFIIADFNDERVLSAFSKVYNSMTGGIRFFDASELYEEVFGRIPLSVLNDQWLGLNVTRYSHSLFDTIKRVTDIVIALPMAILSLVLYPFIILAIKLEDGGPAIISMPRIGLGGAPFMLYKFRSMTGNDGANYGPGGASTLTVTRVGRVLRRTRLDELPQLWGVIKGELSLTGPRPEAPALVSVYEKEIPYYHARHLVKPGIFGWAALYHHTDPHHGTAVEETRKKLSYDLYYLKHRSVLLDLTTILKTLRRLLIKSNS